MSFCVECGTPLTDPERCPKGHLQVISQAVNDEPIELPKLVTRRRLLGAGIEFLTYLAIPGALAFMTLGLMDGLAVPIIVLMIALRDAQSGLFSIAKRISKSRVVDFATGRAATNGQALRRNSYYIILMFFMVSPVLVLDLVAWTAFWGAMLIDVALIVTGPNGRRLGDFLADTQVVPELRRTS